MPWTGPYVFTRDNSSFTGPTVWDDDFNAGTKITTTHHDFHDQDIADGFALVLRNDGVNSPTASINWGGFKITNQANGTVATDSATYGQTVTAASLNSGTNVLTLTRATGDVTVDLSALAVGGSTTDFARYSNSLNPFQGSAYFAGASGLGCVNIFTLLDPITVSGATYTWAIEPLTSTSIQIFNTAGAVLDFSGNSGAATLKVNGSPVWTEASLPVGNSVLTQTGGPYTVTGTWAVTGPWTFTNTSLKLPGFLWSAGVGGTTWTAGPADASQIVFTDPGGLSPLIYQLDAAPKAGAYLQIGPSSKRVWDQGSLQTGLTALPTGGEDGNLAVVQSGAARGLYTRISGTWTLLIAFP